MMTANERVRLEALAASLNTVARCERAIDALVYRLPAGNRLNAMLGVIYCRIIALTAN